MESRNGKYYRNAAFLLFSAALVLRLLFLLHIDSPQYFAKYTYFASQLAQGESIGERIVDISPFYLYFVTAWHALFGPWWQGLKLFQSVLGAVNCLLVFALGIRFFYPVVGLIAGTIMAAYGNIIVLESTIEPTVFVILFNLLTAFFLSGAAKSESSGRTMAAAGFFTGLSIITKPSFLIFIPVVWLFCLWVFSGPMKIRLRHAILYTAVAMMMVLPVTLRNYLLLGDVVLVTADAGKVFFHGNGPGANALEWTFLDDGFLQETSDEPDFEHTLFRKAAAKMTGRKLLPSEASKFWFRQTMEHILSHPIAHLRIEAEKLLFFFTDYELHYIAPAYKDYKDTGRYPFLRYGWIAGFGLAGLLLSIPALRQRLPLFGLFCVTLSSCLIFVVQSRYRTPAVPILALFAGFTILWLVQRFRQRRLISAGIVLISAFSLSTVSFNLFDQRIRHIDRHQTAVNIHYYMEARPLFSKKDFQEAAVALDRSIRLEPAFAPSRLLRGKVSTLLRRFESAEKDFLIVTELEPNSAGGYKNLGMLYLLWGLNDKAKPLLEKAEKIRSGDETVAHALRYINGKTSVPVNWTIDK